LSETTGIVLPLPLNVGKICEICERHHIRRLSLFGSVLRDDFSPQSDIDVLAEFDPGKTPGFRWITIQDELAEIFGRPVDLNTPNSLSKYFRDRVLASARVIYERA
jgi:predicted nucleotidyltransferase